MQAKQIMEFIHHFPWGQVFSHLQNSQATSGVMVTWLEKHHHSKCPCFLSFPCFISWAWYNMLWNSSLVSLGQLSSPWPFQNSCGPPAYSLGEFICIIHSIVQMLQLVKRLNYLLMWLGLIQCPLETKTTFAQTSICHSVQCVAYQYHMWKIISDFRNKYASFQLVHT